MNLPITNKVKYAVCAFVVVAALAAGAIYVASLLRTQPQSDMGDKATFIKVNGYPVTLWEYDDMKRQFANNIRIQQSYIESVKQQTPLAHDPMVFENFVELTRVMERHGPGLGALGSLIMDYARYSEMAEAGFAGDDDSIAAMVSEIRVGYETSVQTSPQDDEVDEFTYYIESYGEKGFWDEIYPNQIRLRLGMMEWQDDAVQDRITRGAPISNERGIILYDIELEVLTNAEVEIIEISALETEKVTVEDAKAYMSDYLKVMHDTN